MSFLRGELWGLDDNVLFQYHRAGGRFSYLTTPPEGTDRRIAEAFELLREAREWARQFTPGAALARIFGHLGIIAYGATQNLGETRSGNLLKALTLARSLSVQGQSFADAVERLAFLMDCGDIEGMSVEPGRSDAVQIMNLHRAKGLEAPIVFLADPNVSADYSPLFSIHRDQEKPIGHFLVATNEGFHRRELARPLDWKTKALKEEAFRDAEEARLLYVAATRAQQMLVVSVHQRRSKRLGGGQAGGPWARFSKALAQDLLPVEPARARPPRVDLGELREELSKARQEMEEAHAAVVQPTYAVRQVTEADPPRVDHQPTGERAGRGVLWGRVVHRLLETLMRNETLDIACYVDYLLQEEGLSLENREEVLRMVERIRASELWHRACHAKKRFVEVPFALTIPNANLGEDERPLETVIKGVVDLAFSEEADWVIVDYKSDRPHDSLSRLVAHYAPQVQQYRRYWEALSGQSTKAALFFVETGQVEWVV
jgi:ATP-dependent helicase/nuclease subunit A